MLATVIRCSMLRCGAASLHALARRTLNAPSYPWLLFKTPSQRDLDLEAGVGSPQSRPLEVRILLGNMDTGIRDLRRDIDNSNSNSARRAATLTPSLYVRIHWYLVVLQMEVRDSSRTSPPLDATSPVPRRDPGALKIMMYEATRPHATTQI
jgi:hypothetical protein